MSNIRIESTQNVAIDLELAGAGNRIGAMAIDLCVWIGYILLISILLDAMDFDKYVMWLLCLPLAFYHFIFEIVMNGQSPGKKALKLKVVRLDGTKATVGDYATRWVFRMIDSFGPVWAFSIGEAVAMIFLSGSFGIIGIISIASSKYQQRLGDMAAGTTVVRLKKRASLEDTILQSYSKDHEVKIKNVLDLSDNDIRIIKKALDIYDKSNNSEHIDKLAKKASEVLKIKYKGSSVGFLRAIMKDYNVKANEVEE